jgi:hypothetical protein
VSAQPGYRLPTKRVRVVWSRKTAARPLAAKQLSRSSWPVETQRSGKSRLAGSEREGDPVATIARDQIVAQDTAGAMFPMHAIEPVVGDEIALEDGIGGKAEPEAEVAPARSVPPEHVAARKGGLEGVVGRVRAVVADDEVFVGGRAELVAEEEAVARPAQVVAGDQIAVRSASHQDARCIAPSPAAAVDILRAVPLQPARRGAVETDTPRVVVGEIAVGDDETVRGDRIDPDILLASDEPRDPGVRGANRADPAARAFVWTRDVEEGPLARTVVGKVAILDDDLLAVEREERPVVSAYHQMADHDSAAALEQDADATAPSAIEDRSATVDHQIVRSDAERTVGRGRGGRSGRVPRRSTR